MNDRGVPLETTRELVEEVLRTSLALEDVMASLLEALPDDAFPGEDNARILLEMVVGSVHPAAAAAGEDGCRTTIALVRAVRERILADLREALRLAGEREGKPGAEGTPGGCGG